MVIWTKTLLEAVTHEFEIAFVPATKADDPEQVLSTALFAFETELLKFVQSDELKSPVVEPLAVGKFTVADNGSAIVPIPENVMVELFAVVTPCKAEFAKIAPLLNAVKFAEVKSPVVEPLAFGRITEPLNGLEAVPLPENVKVGLFAV